MKALITGASSGIGKEIARYLAELGYDLILVSRSTDKLNKLKEELSNVNVRVITLDFSRESDSMDLYEHIKNENEQIDFLVNNAGFGAYGKFLDVPLERELELIHTNVSTVHILTKLFLKDMAERNSGYILNVGSAAGFLAGHLQATMRQRIMLSVLLRRFMRKCVGIIKMSRFPYFARVQ